MTHNRTVAGAHRNFISRQTHGPAGGVGPAGAVSWPGRHNIGCRQKTTPNQNQLDHHSDKTTRLNRQLIVCSSESCLATRKQVRDKANKRWSRAARAVSRCAVELELLVSSLHSGVWFCLLCFQPEPMPRSLPARSPQPPPK